MSPNMREALGRIFQSQHGGDDPRRGGKASQSCALILFTNFVCSSSAAYMDWAMMWIPVVDIVVRMPR